MTHVRIKGFKLFKDRQGKQRCYHRATGSKIDLDKYPIGSAQFIAECARIAKLSEPKVARVGTLGGVIAAYKQHSAFTNLAPRTQKDYNKQFDYLKPLHDIGMAEFDRPAIVQIRDKAEKKHGWHFANYLTRTTSVLFNWAIDRGLCDVNPVAGLSALPRPKTIGRANRRWTDAEIITVMSSCPPHMLTALAIMLYTGLRPHDALRVKKSDYKDGIIRLSTSKTGQGVAIYALKPLREILAQESSESPTLAVNSYGKPWSYHGFSNVWRQYRDELCSTGKTGEGLTLYGLRHTAATILREEGFDNRTIADYLGQSTESMARHYSRGADLEIKMKQVGKQMDEAIIRRGKLSNQDAKVSNRN